jgi:hypothetical protein
MGLKLKITKALPFQIEQIGAYWIIISIFFDKIRNNTRAKLTCYKDEESSKLVNIELININIIDEILFIFDGIDYTREKLYNLIKLDERFINSIDC